MSLKLMYITNEPKIALIAENAGVDRILVDMEYIGKDIRQAGMNTVQSFHTIDDVKKIRKVLSKSKLIVRVNPIHKATRDYMSSEDEINSVIDAGADIIMLPYFQTVEEVELFIKIVGGRVKVNLLLESKSALEKVDSILNVAGVDEIHIGLNDLSIDLKRKFMFELLADGTVEMLCQKFRFKGIPYGFGGVGRLGKGDVPAEKIIKEHYRLGSTLAILSRSFCVANNYTDLNELEKIFNDGVKEIRNLEAECLKHQSYFTENEKSVKELIKNVSESR